MMAGAMIIVEAAPEEAAEMGRGKRLNGRDCYSRFGERNWAVEIAKVAQEIERS